MAALKIEKLLTPYNFTNKNSTARIKYIVIHYVGATGGAKGNCNYSASKYIGASAHYFVGFDGEIWQSVEDEDIAWHCGASSYKHPECRNSNSIGIELCVRCKGKQTADSKDWYFEDKTVMAAAELVRSLMKKYKVDADHVIRHYDVTGKICPNPYVYNHTEHTWDEFKKLITAADEETKKSELTKITGKAVATAEQMAAYIKAKNSKVAQSVLDMIPLYLSEGAAENIRGDIAFAQSCLETGNFTFKGSAVELSQNNFAGMGVTKNGEKGEKFGSAELGIRAQIQHLKAYANTAKLKGKCVDKRFDLVQRGCAAYVEYLGMKENPKGKGWAAGAGYGQKILDILDGILKASDKPGKTPKDKKPEKVPDEQTEASFEAYTVTTTCDTLNIRSGAGESYRVVGSIREYEGAKKQYTIVKEKNGWGKLKSGAGWIALEHTKRTDGKPTSKPEAAKKVTPYLVITTCNSLNIRSGAGEKHRVTGVIKEPEGKKNKYTIVEEKNGWGRLKSGAGWIALKHTKAVS